MHRARSLVFASLTLLLSAFVCAQDKAPAGPPAEPQGMVKIFNGKDLTDWSGDPKLWSVKDGAIRGETTKEVPAAGNTFIIWKGGTLKDFDLRLSFHVSKANNSGIQYRSKHVTEGNPRNNWVVRGYQAEVRYENTGGSVGGFIYDEGGKRGRMVMPGQKVVWENGKANVVSTWDTAAYTKSIKQDGWNDYVIIARGNHIQHFINGHPVIDFTDGDPALALKEGILALQLHAGAPMFVEFKDIRIKHY